jgi:hypothetical protein
MRGARLLPLAALALGLALSACAGDDDGAGGAEGYDRVYRYPTGAGDTVVRLDLLGGVQPEGAEFLDLPAVLIAGDGSVYTPASVVTPYPGPLVPQMSVRTLTPAGIDAVLGVADASGLLAETDAGSPPPPDAEAARVELHAQGDTFVHQASVNETGAGDDPARTAVLGFVDVLRQLESVAGPGQLGLGQAYVPEEYRFRAVPVDPADFERNGMPPRVVPWPVDVGVGLAEATECATADADAVRDLFEAADQLTLFLDGAQTYQLFVAPRLPFDDGC